MFQYIFLRTTKEKMYFYNTSYINEENSCGMKLKIYWHYKRPRDNSLKLFENLEMA